MFDFFLFDNIFLDVVMNGMLEPDQSKRTNAIDALQALHKLKNDIAQQRAKDAVSYSIDYLVDVAFFRATAVATASERE